LEIFPPPPPTFEGTTTGSGAIDLNDPSVYRDLSKPIGALNDERLKELKERYAEWDDPTGGDVPAFLYGTHYSNIGSVLYFLSRMEPYTAQMVTTDTPL
jgi:hypothetical protein